MSTRARFRSPYTDRWRDQVRAGAQSSADALAPVLVKEFAPTSMVDVGAGEGWFAKAFAELGVATTTVDGAWVDDVVQVDLSTPPYPDLGRFDLALCLEVAEHVEAASADELVAWLCSLAPLVVFSAAIPGQGGEGHVNEQPPAYWCDLFDVHGYHGSGALRWRLWGSPDIEPWYIQNVLVFADDTATLARAFGEWNDGCPYVVHPGMWAWKGHG